MKKKKKNTLLILGVVGLGAFLLYQHIKKTTVVDPPVTDPALEPPTAGVVPPKDQVVTESAKPKVGGLYGYFASRLPGARPDMPYGVRWGGVKFEDTTMKANMVL
jgi:hypothetical protein